MNFEKLEKDNMQNNSSNDNDDIALEKLLESDDSSISNELYKQNEIILNENELVEKLLESDDDDITFIVRKLRYTSNELSECDEPAELETLGVSNELCEPIDLDEHIQIIDSIEESHPSQSSQPSQPSQPSQMFDVFDQNKVIGFLELSVNDVLNYYYFIRRCSDLKVFNEKMNLLITHCKNTKFLDFELNNFQEYIFTLLSEMTNDDIYQTVSIALDIEILKKDALDNNVSHDKIIKILEKEMSTGKENYIEMICKLINEEIKKHSNKHTSVGLLKKIFILPFNFAVGAFGALSDGLTFASSSLFSLSKKKN